MWWGICLWVTIDLIPIYALILFLIFHSRYQQYSPWSGKTKNIWICPISISDIPCIDIQCIFHSSSNFCSSYNSSSCYHQWWGWWMAMWSMVQNTGQGRRLRICCIECDGLAAEISWLDFDFVQLILMLLVQWSLSLLYEKNAFSFFEEFWNVSEQLPDARMWDKY